MANEFDVRREILRHDVEAQEQKLKNALGSLGEAVERILNHSEKIGEANQRLKDYDAYGYKLQKHKKKGD